jgi:hypothetical protein
MNERTSTFQLILMSFAGSMAVVGVVTFAFFRAQSGSTGAPITVWGTLPQDVFDNVLTDLQGLQLSKGNITYFAKLPEEIDSDLVEAIADNVAPDVVILEVGQMFQHSKRFMTVPYESLPLETLDQTFVGGGAFAGATGVAAVPILIDPLVLYSNTARFSSAGIASAPGYWDQVLAVTPDLTELGPSRSVSRSAIALGEYGNVAHAKEIFFAVANQAGAPMFAREIANVPGGDPVDQYRVLLSGQQGGVSQPGSAALLFFSQFADASKDVYTWNRSLPMSTERFVSGDLAMYLGFGSERAVLRDQNPNLPIGITPIPQSRAAADRSTYGRFYAAAIVRTTKSPADAFAAAWAIASAPAQKALSAATGMAPSRRELLDSPDYSRADQTTVYASAVMSRPALQPNPGETGKVIERMMGNVSSGRLPVDEATSLAQQELELLYGKSLAGTAPEPGS